MEKEGEVTSRYGEGKADKREEGEGELTSRYGEEEREKKWRKQEGKWISR